MSARPGRVKTKTRNLKRGASARPALSRSRRRRKPAALAKLIEKVDGLGHMFNAELCEKPSGPHGLHIIHFSPKQLDRHAQTCFDAWEALNQLSE